MTTLDIGLMEKTVVLPTKEVDIVTKEVLVAASFHGKKIYENPEFAELPSEIKREARALCAGLAEKMRCVCTVGFYGDGSLFFEARAEDGGRAFDDELARREIAAAQARQKELIRALRLWYVAFRTEDGRRMRKTLDNSFYER